MARKRSEKIDEELRRERLKSNTLPAVNLNETFSTTSTTTTLNLTDTNNGVDGSTAYYPSTGPKILLLGAGDSGKTTVLKQLKILHGNGFSDSERAQYRCWIMDNIVDSMRAILHAMDRLGIPYGEHGNEVKGQLEVWGSGSLGLISPLVLTPPTSI